MTRDSKTERESEKGRVRSEENPSHSVNGFLTVCTLLAYTAGRYDSIIYS